MDKQFTASEVRDLSRRMAVSLVEMDARPPKDEHVMAALDAFADLLETREKAVPVELDFYDAGLLNDFGGGNVIWWWDYMRDELGRAHSFYQSQVNDMMLAAHSAQTQPPAVSMTDAMPKVPVNADEVELEDAWWNAWWSACRDVTLDAQENPNG